MLLEKAVELQEQKVNGDRKEQGKIVKNLVKQSKIIMGECWGKDGQ